MVWVHAHGTAAACAPAQSLLPSHSRAKAPRSTTSHELRRGNTSASACDSEPPTAASIVRASELQKRSLVSRAPPICSRHSALGACRQGSRAISYQSPSSVLTQPLRNSHLVSLALLLVKPVICRSLQKLSIRVRGVPRARPYMVMIRVLTWVPCKL